MYFISKVFLWPSHWAREGRSVWRLRSCSEPKNETKQFLLKQFLFLKQKTKTRWLSIFTVFKSLVYTSVRKLNWGFISKSILLNLQTLDWKCISPRRKQNLWAAIAYSVLAQQHVDRMFTREMGIDFALPSVLTCKRWIDQQVNFLKSQWDPFRQFLMAG